MHEELYDELRLIEEVHWWLTTRRCIFLHFLAQVCRRFSTPPLLLDCGSGTGRLLRSMCEFSRPVGIDLSPHSLSSIDDRHPYAFVRAKTEELPFGDNTFDIVCAFDVLEHLDADGAALERIHQVLRPGGYLFVSVPAYRFLWDAQDEMANHRRRYQLRELRGKLRKANFVVEKSTYFNSILFPLVATVRLVRKALAYAHAEPPRSDFSLTPPGPLNDILRRIFMTELPLIKRFDFPFGGSIFCIARRA